jgi:hypothetical protein
MTTNRVGHISTNILGIKRYTLQNDVDGVGAGALPFFKVTPNDFI